ncbi:Crp/Fnr family transcriptional regulator [Rhodobacteraceae bacterium CCMM004]|nr:Crp/Fnr family transcriptional regulator [Rhodobacteraceae bacterium CCMM004]
MADPPAWRSHFPGLAQLAPEMAALLDRRARRVRFRAGETLFGPAEAPQSLLLLISGTVRVQQVSESGREIVLYRVHGGESCVLTTACLLAHEDYLAEGTAETDVEAIALPRDAFDRLLAESPAFRTFVFQTYSQRITDLFLVIEEVAFKRVDIRLAQRLLALADAQGHLRATHHDLAVELGTAREVVSRTLQEFQRRGWVILARGSVAIADRAGLEGLADEGAR